jgi:hypothetical protein
MFLLLLPSFFFLHRHIQCIRKNASMSLIGKRTISSEGHKVLVLSEIMAATHDHVFVKIIGVDVFLIGFLLLVFDLRVVFRTSFLALNMRMARVRQFAFLVSTLAFLRVVGALDHMTLVALGTIFAIPKQGKRTADERAWGGGDMGIAARIIRAVAVEEMGASRHTIVRRLVGEVAVVAVGAASGAEERLTHGNLFRVVIKAALGAKGTDTWTDVRSVRVCLPADDHVPVHRAAVE